MPGKTFKFLCNSVVVFGLFFCTPYLWSIKGFPEPHAAILIFACAILMIFCFIIPTQKEFEGIKETVNDDITIAYSRETSAYSSDKVIAVDLPTKTKDKINNTLQSIEDLDDREKGIVAGVLVPLLSALAVTAVRLQENTDALGTILLFIFAFSIFRLLVVAYFTIRIGIKNSRIVTVVQRPDFDANKMTRPYYFKCDYTSIEGYPLKQKHGVDCPFSFFYFLMSLRKTNKKEELTDLLKRFISTESSSLSEIEKAKAKFQLMEELDNLAKTAKSR